jgi:hypothetical protein
MKKRDEVWQNGDEGKTNPNPNIKTSIIRQPKDKRINRVLE